jgi:tripartite-type tricarboxylate transporter receptor subunit TctC
VAKAAPDGYTLLVAGTPHVINPSLFPTPYDALKDFAPIATIAKSRQILVVHPSLPVVRLKELIALAKARPGQLNYSSSGTGNTNHLAGELLCALAGIKMQHIPYKGAGPALEPFISNPEAFAALLKSDMARFAKLIKDANIKIEQ